MKGVVSSTSGSSNNGGERVVVGRSGSEKEKTKMRERQRRAITTNIFHGLRKHGGYQLSSRADINQVLRELARESGWVVEPDGTTYRSTIPNAFCPLCGAGRRSATPTPTTSTIAVASGECSATASPQCFTTGDSTLYVAGAGSGVINAPSCQVLKSGHDMPFAIYDVYGRVAGEIHRCSNQRFGPEGAAPAMAVADQQQQEQYLLEARASNQNTPNGSPSRHV